MNTKRYFESEKRRVSTAVKNISRALSEGWQIELHDDENPLIMFNSAILADQRVDAPYTLTSPSGKKYHGDHISLYHGPFLINRGGYQFFRDEPFNVDAFHEICQAFGILTLCNNLRNPKDTLAKLLRDK